MEDLFKTLPQYTCSRSNDSLTFYNFQAHWDFKDLIEGGILALRNFKDEPSDIFFCSSPKTGTTWLKALAFAIVTRKQFDESTSPLLTTLPHECLPFLEQDLKQIEGNHKKSKTFPLVSTHFPYASLPESVIASKCKIVYIYRNIKDVIVSYYNFIRDFTKVDEAPFEAVFDEFYQGISWRGPYLDHVLGYWKASLENPDRILFLKYEDLKKDIRSDVKKLAEFMGYPFSTEEEEAGVIENIVKLCDFKNLSNLEVNKSGKHRANEAIPVENRLYFRKAKVGDWENYFTDEMKEKIDKLVEQKLTGTGLVLK